MFNSQQILRHSRANATKVIFLVTDGYSNGGDPRPVAAALRERGVEIFTLGIWQGNIRELHDMASQPKDQHCYLVHNFAEFEALARRALHEGENSEYELLILKTVKIRSSVFVKIILGYCFMVCIVYISFLIHNKVPVLFIINTSQSFTFFFP